MSRLMMDSEKECGSGLKLLVYWLVVSIPLGWGVWQVVAKSLVLFGVSN